MKHNVEDEVSSERLGEYVTKFWRSFSARVIVEESNLTRQIDTFDSAVDDLTSTRDVLKKEMESRRPSTGAELITHSDLVVQCSETLRAKFSALRLIVENAQAYSILGPSYSAIVAEELRRHCDDIQRSSTAYTNLLRDGDRQWKAVSGEVTSEKISRMRRELAEIELQKTNVPLRASAQASAERQTAASRYSEKMLATRTRSESIVVVRAGLTFVAGIVGVYLGAKLDAFVGLGGLTMSIFFGATAAIGAWNWLDGSSANWTKFVRRRGIEQATSERNATEEAIEKDKKWAVEIDVQRLGFDIERLKREIGYELAPLLREQKRAQTQIMQKVYQGYAEFVSTFDMSRYLYLERLSKTYHTGHQERMSVVRREWSEALDNALRDFQVEADRAVTQAYEASSTKCKVGSKASPAPRELGSYMSFDLTRSFRMPLVVDLMDSCYLRHDLSPESLEAARRLASWHAMEIWRRNGGAHVTIFDPAGLGSGYRELLAISRDEDDVTPLAATRDLSERLSELMRTAAARNRALATSGARDWLTRSTKISSVSERAEVLLLEVPRSGLGSEQREQIEALLGVGPSAGVILIVVDAKDRKDDHGMPSGIAREVVILGSIALEQGYSLEIPGRDELVRKERAILDLAADKKLSSAAQGNPADPPSSSFAEFIGAVVPRATRWQSDLANTDENISIPIGVADNGDVTNLVFDDGAAHALLLGGTGSGKTNFLHTLIQAGCIKFSSDELRLYLADLKNGVSFEPYARHDRFGSHFGAVACTSSMGFGAVLVDAVKREMQRRYDTFKQVQRRQENSRVQDLADYRKLASPSDEKLPRLLLIIDEFQALFDDATRRRQTGADLVTLLKQGRGAGVHVMLATQSLRGKASDLDEALSQIHTRMMLKAAKSDASSIFRSTSLAQHAIDYCSKPGKCFMAQDLGENDGRGFTNPESKDNNFFFSTLDSLTTASPPPANQVPIVWNDDVGSLRDNFLFRSRPGRQTSWFLGLPYSAEHALDVPLENGVTTAMVAVEDRGHARALVGSLLMSLSLWFDGADVFWLQPKRDSGPLRRRDFDSMARDLGLTEVKYLDSLRSLAAVFAIHGGEEGKRPQVAIVPDVTTLDGKRSASGSSWAGPLTGGGESGTSSDIDHLLSIASLSAESPRIVLLLAASCYDLLDSPLKSVNDLANIRITHGRQKGSRTREFLRVNDLPEMAEDDLVLMTEKRSSPMTFRPFDEKWSN